MWGRGFWRRLRAIVVKEVQQLRRDRLTFAMMFGVPIMQLLLFGYAIDTDPHHLPAAVVSADALLLPMPILRARLERNPSDFAEASADATRVAGAADAAVAGAAATAGAAGAAATVAGG